ncbi:MAG: hypothetical protein PHY34_03545 [Patescibacteria group bacterium]|nr:hypothetical protein [Patescibacteria group bacterium]MDD5715643.1 hypothetical protein [Patescibacteria group bacterium]
MTLTIVLAVICGALAVLIFFMGRKLLRLGAEKNTLMLLIGSIAKIRGGIKANFMTRNLAEVDRAQKLFGHAAVLTSSTISWDQFQQLLLDTNLVFYVLDLLEKVRKDAHQGSISFIASEIRDALTDADISPSRDQRIVTLLTPLLAELDELERTGNEAEAKKLAAEIAANPEMFTIQDFRRLVALMKNAGITPSTIGFKANTPPIVLQMVETLWQEDADAAMKA